MYIGFSVQIHGLPDNTDLEVTRERVCVCLSEEFEPSFKSDIVVDIEEYTPQPPGEKS